MTASQWLLAVVTYAVLLLLLWRGRGPDRIAAVALLVTQTATPFMAVYEVEGVRVGVAGLSLLLTLTLIGLACQGRRWWLLAAAGVQLVAVSSWIYQILDPGAQVWAAVTFRIIVWMELMALAVFGLFEARFAPYARPQS